MVWVEVTICRHLGCDLDVHGAKADVFDFPRGVSD